MSRESEQRETEAQEIRRRNTERVGLLCLICRKPYSAGTRTNRNHPKCYARACEWDKIVPP